MIAPPPFFASKRFGVGFVPWVQAYATTNPIEHNYASRETCRTPAGGSVMKRAIFSLRSTAGLPKGSTRAI